MKFMLPTRRRQVKNFVYKFKQVHNSVSLYVLIVFINKDVIFLLLIDDA